MILLVFSGVVACSLFAIFVIYQFQRSKIEDVLNFLFYKLLYVLKMALRIVLKIIKYLLGWLAKALTAINKAIRCVINSIKESFVSVVKVTGEVAHTVMDETGKILKVIILREPEEPVAQQQLNE